MEIFLLNEISENLNVYVELIPGICDLTLILWYGKHFKYKEQQFFVSVLQLSHNFYFIN